MKNLRINEAVALAIVVLFIFVGYACSGAEGNTADMHTLDISSSQELKEFFRYTEGHLPIVSSHRGGAREGYPENALVTFENTLRHTWSLMEVDPRYSKDSVIVLFHDPTLERTSTGQGRVSEHTYGQLRQLRLKDIKGQVTDYHMPTLGEALDWARGKTVLFLDNKDVPVADRVRAIQRHQAHAHAVVMVYSFGDAKEVYKLDPDIVIQVFIPDEMAVARFEQTGIPWDNVVAFVTHKRPGEEHRTVLELLRQKGVMAVIGTSRTLDRDYLNGDLDKDELEQSYRGLIDTGASILEADLGIEAGQAVESLWPTQSPKQQYFKQ